MTTFWFETLRGDKFYPEDPDPKLIDIETIATVLARLPRFGGHSQFFYSVAQHSIHVAELVQEQTLKLPALLHDACEVYSGYGDVLRPAKQCTSWISEMEQSVNDAIAQRFGFSAALFAHDAIKHADNVLLATEREHVKGISGNAWDALPEPLDPARCRIGTMLDPAGMFLAMAERYRQLGGWPSFDKKPAPADAAAE